MISDSMLRGLGAADPAGETELMAHALTRDLLAAYRRYLFDIAALAQTVWALGGMTLRCPRGRDWSRVIEALDVAEGAGFVRFTVRGRTADVAPGDVEPAAVLPALLEAMTVSPAPPGAWWVPMVLGTGVSALLAGIVAAYGERWTALERNAQAMTGDRT